MSAASGVASSQMAFCHLTEPLPKRISNRHILQALGPFYSRALALTMEHSIGDFESMSMFERG